MVCGVCVREREEGGSGKRRGRERRKSGSQRRHSVRKLTVFEFWTEIWGPVNSATDSYDFGHVTEFLL